MDSESKVENEFDLERIIFLLKDIYEMILDSLFIINIHLGNVKKDPKYFEELKALFPLVMKSQDHLEVIQLIKEKNPNVKKDLEIIDSLITIIGEKEDSSKEFYEKSDKILNKLLRIISEINSEKENQSLSLITPRIV